MLEVETPRELAQHVGTVLGRSDWVTLTQAQIDQYAELTGDDHWVHVDQERARAEMPDGKTIGHGFFILSLIPLLARDIFHIKKRGKGLNYGLNRVRFTSPVPVGSRLRLSQTLLAAEAAHGGTRFTFSNTFELDGQTRPALVAEMLLLIYD